MLEFYTLHLQRGNIEKLEKKKHQKTTAMEQQHHQVTVTSVTVNSTS